MDPSLSMVYQVYALSSMDLANSLRHSSVSCVGAHNVNEPTHVFHSASISSVKRMELWGSYPLGYGLPRSSGGNGGSRENCLGIPESFSLSCFRRALTSASVRYWELVLPPTTDPSSG